MNVMYLAAASAPAPIPTSVAPLPVNASQTVSNTPLAPPVAHSWFAIHAGWATHTLAALALLFAFSLIFLLAIQTTKQEGLSGTIGGRVESAYRGRLGMEENLKRLTGFVAVSLVVIWAILSLTGI